MAALCPAALAFLKAHRSEGHILKWHGKRLKTFKMTYQHLAERARITGYSSYSLRKLGATYMRRNRVSELDIKTMLAHSIKGETGRYAHEEPEYLVDVRRIMQQLLEALDPPWLHPYLAAGAPALTNDAFWSMTYPDAAGCWLWGGARTPDGYGHTGRELAYRTAFELARGRIPNGTTVRHLCGVRACCRPDHLVLVTAADHGARQREAQRVTHHAHLTHEPLLIEGTTHVIGADSKTHWNPAVRSDPSSRSAMLEGKKDEPEQLLARRSPRAEWRQGQVIE